MKILVVCQRYYPEKFQITDICEQLVKDGHVVTVLTGLPNYPTGIIPTEYKNGKNRLEYINGVKVIRSFEIGRKKGTFGLARNYISYCVSATIKSFFMKEEYDLVFVYQLSPILMGYPGMIYAKKKRKPLLLYCCDIWPESVKVLLKSETSLVFRIIKRISTSIYQSADKIIIQSKGFADYFESLHKISRNKIKYIPQFSESSYLEENFKLENGIVDFVFLGNIGIAQDIETILKAIEINKDILGYKMHFVGEGSYLDEAKQIVKQKKLEDKVIFYGRRSFEEMPQFYKLADVCLVTLKADSLISMTLPSKVQGYMAAGKPILAALNGTAKQIIEEAQCGLCVNTSNAVELAQAMRKMIDSQFMFEQYGKNARNYYRKNFTKELFMESLEKEFEKLVK